MKKLTKIKKWLMPFLPSPFRPFALLLLLLLCSWQVSRSQSSDWEKIALPDSLSEIYDIYCVDKNTLIAWMGGINSSVWHSADGGYNWKKVITSKQESERIVYSTRCSFLNNKIGYHFSNIKLYKTGDGGIMWDEVCTLPTSVPNRITAIDEDNVVIIDHHLRMFVSHNGGVTFSQHPGKYIDFCFKDGLGLAVTDKSKIYKTLDTCKTWELVRTLVFDVDYYLNFRSELHIRTPLKVSYFNIFKAIHTEDLFKTYKITSYPVNVGSCKLVFKDNSNEGIMLKTIDDHDGTYITTSPYNSALFYTNDYGQTFDLIRSYPADTLGYVILSVQQKENCWYLLEKQRPTYLHKQTNLYRNSKGIGVNENQEKSSIKVYPNPAQDLLFITAEEEIEKIEIVDITGVLVFSEINYKSNNINISHLQTGVYFVKTTTNNKINITKIIKL